MEPIVFMFCLTLHNIEEALWLTQWQSKHMPNARRIVQKEHFIFAAVGISVLGCLAAGLHLLYPDEPCFKYAFAGFVGAMLFNAIIPHLLMTIIHRSYCPGVFTGLCLILPLHSLILVKLAGQDFGVKEILVASLVVGLILIGCIPVLNSLAKRCLTGVYIKK